MKKYTLKQYVLIPVIIFLFILAVLLTVWAEKRITPGEPVLQELDTGIGDSYDEAVVFSLPSGFYGEDQVLFLQASEADQILYSMDGTDPRVSGIPYTGGVELPVKEEMYSCVVSACAVYSDGTMSEKVTRSYFVSANINTRFDCLVFSITIDPDELYNYEDGLFIAGKMRDDYLAANPDIREEDLSPTDPANWNQSGRASEREAYVEVFEEDGTCVIAQPCGFRIFGRWSRSYDQKNIRLYARSEYDTEDNRFRYEFFPDAMDSLGCKLTSYKRISLRANGNDQHSLFMRDDLLSSLMLDAGLEAKYSRPAAVFLNGEYYGFTWCQQVFSGDLLDHKYNLEESEWDILSGDGNGWVEEDTENEYWEKASSDWQHVCNYAYQDLTDDAVFDALCQELDIENFLTYYAFNAYIAKEDWPCNNIKMFRYSTERNAPVDPNLLSADAKKICDGKWRFFCYDSDYTLGLYGFPASRNNIEQLFDQEYFNYFEENDEDPYTVWNRCDLLMALCKREDVREQFLTIMCDIMNWHFGVDRAISAVDDYHNWRIQELTAAQEAGLVNLDNLESELAYVKSWIQERPVFVQEQLRNVFPAYSEYVNITIQPVQGAAVQINTVTVSAEDGVFSGQYFAGIDLPVSCTIEPGYEFDHWEVNGMREDQQSFLLNSNALSDAQIDLTLYLRRKTSDVRISEVCYKSSTGDYFVITNYGSEAESTFGMRVWDGGEQNAFFLPKMYLKAGESQKIVCRNYITSDAIGLLEAPFNLKESETLTLYAADGRAISEVSLENGTEGTALKLNTKSGRYEEYSLIQ